MAAALPMRRATSVPWPISKLRWMIRWLIQTNLDHTCPTVSEIIRSSDNTII